jgi:hypothetical protein
MSKLISPVFTLEEASEIITDAEYKEVKQALIRGFVRGLAAANGSAKSPEELEQFVANVYNETTKYSGWQGKRDAALRSLRSF